MASEVQMFCGDTPQGAVSNQQSTINRYREREYHD